MKILLINPPYTNFEGMKESGGRMFPLGFGYLAAYIREKIKDCEFKILDTEVLGLNYGQIKEKIIQENPAVVGFTAPTPTMKHVYKITEFIKKEINPNCYVVAGGIHPTVMPQRTLEESLIDSVVIGEGEITFFELIREIKNRTFKFSDIKGLAWKNKEGVIKINEPRPLLENLDELPLPARDLYDLSLYFSAPTKKVSDFRVTPILTSRGCAFKCAHCPSATIWGGRVRYRSTQNVIKEIEECINKFDLREFNFFDDTFTVNPTRVKEICQEIIDRKMNIAWISFSRVNTISEDLVKIMKEAGCRKISFGLESGSQEILDKMHKNATVEMGRKAVAIVRKYGLQVHTTFMLGNVGETVETIKKTIKFAKSLDLDNATFFITTPYPGTELYEVAKRINKGLVDIPWENFAPLTNAKPILVQNNLSAKELIYWQKRAFREFYLRPKYIFHKIKQLNSIDALKTISEGLRVFYRVLLKK